ncbi:hypothetical protein GGX14DRAFT_384399 [Mycena pura]|uniref:Uncharacterized protein n=1 Tax=Mycena pura TaxID=153505 RepID=A0AAD6YVA8_9AGAR|nr:hypothetical protein GGX14DRAFT_384399 [Mycena pura]
MDAKWRAASGKKNATGNGGQWEAASGDLQPAGSRKHAEASGVRRTAVCGQRELQRAWAAGVACRVYVRWVAAPARPGVARGTSRKAGSRRAMAAGSEKGGRMRHRAIRVRAADGGRRGMGLARGVRGRPTAFARRSRLRAGCGGSLGDAGSCTTCAAGGEQGDVGLARR